MSRPAPGPDRSPDRALLGPPLVLAAMVILLAGASCLRVPIDRVAGPLSILLALGLAVLLWRARRPRPARGRLLLGALAALAAWVALAQCAGRLAPTAADTLSLRPDAWSYEAFADYLGRFPRGQQDGMPMLDEYGSHLSETRFATPALLAFLHRLPGGEDPAAVQRTFCALCLFVHFFAMLAFTRALTGREGWGVPLATAFAATAAGWLPDAVDLANYDNLIFSALAPALLGLFRPGAGSPSRRDGLAGAILLGAMLYTYPEGTALSGVLALPLVVAVLWGRGPGPAANRAAALAVVVGGAALAAPYLPIFVRFLSAQLAYGLNVGISRPYEGVFPGLLTDHRLPALFALGEEGQGSTYTLVNNLVPGVLLTLAAVGAWTLGRRQRWFPWVAVPVVGLFVWQDILKHYDYGAYKVLILSAWWIYPAVVAGASWTLHRWVRAGAARFALAAGFIAAVGWEKLEDRIVAPPLAGEARLGPLRELAGIRFVTGGAGVLLSVNDDFDQLWATYFLRDQPVVTATPRGYLGMAHILPLLARGSAPAVETCAFVLTSGQQPGALWRNARFSLLRRASAYVTGIENPNGVDVSEGRPWLWLSTRAATLRVVAPAAGNYEVHVRRFLPGPSGPERPERAVVLTDAGGEHPLVVTPTSTGLPLRLRAGENAVQLRCADVPRVRDLSSADPRELMLALDDLSIIEATQP